MVLLSYKILLLLLHRIDGRTGAGFPFGATYRRFESYPIHLGALPLFYFPVHTRRVFMSLLFCKRGLRKTPQSPSI